MPLRRNVAVTVALAVLIARCSCSAKAEDYADDAGLNRGEKALHIIREFADGICQTVPLSGGTTHTELSGSGKADLGKVITKIAGLGFEGAIKYTNSGYQGALQSDVAGLVKEGNECKLKVFEDLKDKLLNEGNSL